MVSVINNNFLHLLDIIKHDGKYSDTNTSNQLNFLLEQFNLIFSKSHRYSVQTKIWSFMILMQSVSAYQSIRETNLIILPHLKYLWRLSSEFCISPLAMSENKNFLKIRSKQT